MTTLTTNIPDAILRHAKQLADKEQITLDQFVSMALAGQISSWQTRENFEERAKQGSWEKAKEILARGSDIDPDPEDTL